MVLTKRTVLTVFEGGVETTRWATKETVKTVQKQESV